MSQKNSLLTGPCKCVCHDQKGVLHCMPCCCYTYTPRAEAEALASLHHLIPNSLRVGVVGYCPPTKFDENEARRMIADAYEKIRRTNPDKPISIISGLTNVGVLKIAYEEASNRGWFTVGIACKQATEHPLYQVDAQAIIGDKWGDESSAFVNILDVIIRIGGGNQSRKETDEIKKRGKTTLEYDLPTL